MSNKLYVPLSLRFSLINDQHVEVMNLLDEITENDKRSKNQIVIDALAEYFQKSAGEEIARKTYVDTDTLEKRLSEEREKLRIEIYQEIIQFIAGNALSGGIKSVPVKQEDVEPQNKEEESDTDSVSSSSSTSSTSSSSSSTTSTSSSSSSSSSPSSPL